MSKDIIVLTPNGRRQKVHCTPDTSILQVLEDVCVKQGFEASAYDLKHHNHILDLTSTIRFSNLPNKACLEMVEVERKRSESNVTVGLTLDDGERRTGEFPPNTTLYDIARFLAAQELEALDNPTILYMRQEVIGIGALKDKTLRQLGLLSGRAILRLLNKAEEQTQANVSAVYRVPPKQEERPKDTKTTPSDPEKSPERVAFDPLTIIKEKLGLGTSNTANIQSVKAAPQSDPILEEPEEVPMQVDEPTKASVVSSSSFTPVNLERRLRIEEEVTFLGAQKAIAFTQGDVEPEELEDLPDDFYELTIEEVRRLHRDLQNQRQELENTPLLTTNQKQILDKQASEQRLNMYKSVVVRVQFPDHMVLQGIFTPNNTVQEVMDFIKNHLATPNKPFHVFTTPLKETLDPKLTLLEAKFVPCVHMHFNWLDENSDGKYLKDEIYLKKTPSDAAGILASKYRAPSRRKIEEVATTSTQRAGSSGSAAGGSKVPKWFKK